MQLTYMLIALIRIFFISFALWSSDAFLESESVIEKSRSAQKLIGLIFLLYSN